MRLRPLGLTQPLRPSYRMWDADLICHFGLTGSATRHSWSQFNSFPHHSYNCKSTPMNVPT